MQCRLSLTCSTKLSAPLLKVPTMEGECHPRQTLRVQIIHASRCRKYIACIVADQTYSSSFYRVPLISMSTLKHDTLLLRDVILSICMHEYHAVNVYIWIPGVCEGLDYVWTWERIPKLRQGKATGMHPGEGDAHQPAFERLVANHQATLSSVFLQFHLHVI